MKDSPRYLAIGLLVGLWGAIGRAQEPPAPLPPGGEVAPILQPNAAEPLAPFVPRVPRTEADRDRLDALRAYVASRALEDQRQWEKAIELLEQARQKDPEAVEVLRRLARLYFGMGRVDDGVESSRRAIEADPNEPETIRRLVRFYLQASKDAEAEQLLNEVLADADLRKGTATELVVLNDLALIQLARNQFDRAAGPLERLMNGLDAREATRLTAGEQELVLGSDPARAYSRFGEAFFNANRYDLAVEAFQHSLAYEPDNPQTPLLLAQSFLKSGKAAEALATLEPILAKKPPGRIAYDVFGQVLDSLDRRAEFLPRLEAAAAADPRNFLLKYALGEQYEESGQVERAREVYRRVISEQPDPQGIQALADSLRAEAKWEDLLQLFETAFTQPMANLALEPQVRLIATDPDEADRFIQTGIDMLKADPPRLGPAGRLILVEIARQADRAEKLVELDRLNLLQDPSPAAYTELVTTLTAAGRHAEAADTITELMTKFPEVADDSRLLGALGEAQFNAGRIEESLATGRKLMEMDPGDFAAIQIVGFALSRQGKNEEAIELYRSVPEKNPGNEQAVKLSRLWISGVYSAMGDQDKAEAELEALLELDPDDPWVNNDLGYMWADRGKNLDRAEQMIRKAVSQDRENGSYRDSLGWVLFKRGKVDEAIRELEEALRLKKGDATIVDHLADAHFRLGKLEEARKLWEEAEKLAAASDPPDKALPQIREKLEALRSQAKPAPVGPPDGNP